MKTTKAITQDGRMVRIEVIIETIHESLYKLQHDLKDKFDRTDKRFDKLQDDMAFNSKDLNFRSWLQFTFLFTMITSVLGIVAKAFKWF